MIMMPVCICPDVRVGFAGVPAALSTPVEYARQRAHALRSAGGLLVASASRWVVWHLLSGNDVFSKQPQLCVILPKAAPLR